MHKPVLLNQVLEIFDPKPGQTFIDGTINGGGHAREIAERVGDTGRVLGIDWDEELVKNLQIRNQESGIRNMLLECGNYTNIRLLAQKHQLDTVDGILFDLGFSSFHIDQSGRGFAFSKDEPLDMRYSDSTNETAADLVNHWSAIELEGIFREYGEERFAKQIARAITESRKRKRISSTKELSEIIVRSVRHKGKGVHPATRTFQALRIAVNSELDNISKGLAAAQTLLHSGGKLIVISFHSLEDRIVKNFFKNSSNLQHINKKPLTASREEVYANPRARSAKLRAVQKI